MLILGWDEMDLYSMASASLRYWRWFDSFSAYSLLGALRDGLLEAELEEGRDDRDEVNLEPVLLCLGASFDERL